MSKISFATFIKDPAKAYAMYGKSIEQEVERLCKEAIEQRDMYMKEVKHLSNQNNVLREANKNHKQKIADLKFYIDYNVEKV